MVVAPSNINEIFKQIIRAFDLADKYQLPVIVLTDQFLLDSRFSVNEIHLAQQIPTFYLADPSKIDDYKRFQVTDSGISPRLYPGQSTHLVTADSDEHDADGHITEDLSGVALAMMKKRLVKFQGLKAEMAVPEEINVDQAETVMVGWGSSRQAILESIEYLKADDVQVGMIHFAEVWPLPEYKFPQGKRYWSVENNATSQLARLLRSEYGLTFTSSINRYDGLPLTGNYVRRCFHEQN
jgi:2-oxoglutarate ferredoxin oxidoreductase subunit alpha